MKTKDLQSFSFRLDALDVAVEAAAMAVSLAEGLPTHLRPIGQQMVRSASSIVLNLGEGLGRVGRSRAHLFCIAYGSAKETSAALALLNRIGAIDSVRAREVSESLDRVQAMTWRLSKS